VVGGLQPGELRREIDDPGSVGTALANQSASGQT